MVSISSALSIAKATFTYMPAATQPRIGTITASLVASAVLLTRPVEQSPSPEESQ
jgi:hypothetical protein